MKNKIFIYLFLSWIFLYCLTENTWAQSFLKIQVSPVRQELNLKPGQSKNIEVRYMNLGTKAVIGEITAVDFIVDENGVSVLTDQKNKPSEKYSAASWISFDSNQIIIPSRETVAVRANISVPQNSAGGGRYAAIVLRLMPTNNPSGEDNSSGAIISSKIASLAIITVDGDIFELAEITGLKIPTFLEYGPIPVEFAIKNKGSVHISPHGSAIISDIFSNNILKQQINKTNIFPESIRKYSLSMGKKNMIGRYKINLGMIYGLTNNSLQSSQYVIILPYKQLSLLLVLMLVFLLVILKIKRRYFSVKKQQI